MKAPHLDSRIRGWSAFAYWRLGIQSTPHTVRLLSYLHLFVPLSRRVSNLNLVTK